MKLRDSRRGIDTHAALALARAHAEAKGSIGLARSVRPQVTGGRPELKVVQRQRRQVGFRISNKVFIAYVTGFVALFAAVVMRAEMAATQLHLNSLNSQLVSMQTQHQRLGVKLASLESPERIVSYAQSRLGMIYPAQVGYLGMAAQPPASQGAAIPITPRVLASHNTLFAPAGEAGGTVLAPPTTSTTSTTSQGSHGAPANNTTVTKGSASTSAGSPAIKSPSVSKSG